MTISIQVSKSWVHLTHIMAEKANKPKTEHSFLSMVLTADSLLSHNLMTQSGGQSSEEALQVVFFSFIPLKSKQFLHNYQNSELKKNKQNK